MSRFSFPFAVVVGAASLSLLPASADAQPAGPSPLCRSFERTYGNDDRPMLHVSCGEAGAVLGAADDHRLYGLPALKAAVIVTVFNGERRVWLVMDGDDGTLAVEELSGTIARAAGRGASGRLDDLEFGFGSDAPGRQNAAVMSFRNRGEGGGAGEIDIGQLIARAREVRGAARPNAGK